MTEWFAKAKNQWSVDPYEPKCDGLTAAQPSVLKHVLIQNQMELQLVRMLTSLDTSGTQHVDVIMWNLLVILVNFSIIF